MPAATQKSELLNVTDREFVKLTALLDKVDEDLAWQAFEDGWSIKDVVVHRTHWIHLFLGWYADGQAGKDVAFPAPGYKWNQLKDYNAMILEQNADMSWSSARVEFLAKHDELTFLLSSLSNDALYEGPMKGAHNQWTTGRWAESAGASHYRSAAKFIRACIRASGQASV